MDDHQDDITALALHPDGSTVATGELGKRPLIIVWDSLKMNIIHKFTKTV